MKTDITYKNYNNKSGIYIIKANEDLFYIGSAVNIHSRMCVHRHLLSRNKHHSKRLQNYVNKYGLDSIYINVIEICCKELLKEREQYYIDTLKPKFNNSPNATSNLGIKLKPLSREHKNKISVSSKGRKLSQETKDRMSISFKNRKIVRKNKFNNYSDKKTVVQYDLNMNLVEIHKSISEASFKTNISIYAISKNITKDTKSSGNFIWYRKKEIAEYCDENLNILENFKLDFVQKHKKTLTRKHTYKIIQIDSNNKVIKEWESTLQAMKTTKITGIAHVLNTEKTAKGFKWKKIEI